MIARSNWKFLPVEIEFIKCDAWAARTQRGGARGPGLGVIDWSFVSVPPKHPPLPHPPPPSLPHPLTHPLERWIRFVRHSQNKQTLSFSQSACFDICIHFKVRLNTENTKTSNLNQTSVCWSTSKINLIRVRVPLMNPQSDTLQMRLMVTFAPLFGFEVALKCLWRAHLITHRTLPCPLLLSVTSKPSFHTISLII